jgi:adenosylmethionine-8-amino-7-oxononanoate aminotransferase
MAESSSVSSLAKSDRASSRPDEFPQTYTAEEIVELKQAAKDHLWLHFTHHSNYYGEGAIDIPLIVKGEGHHIYTIDGEKRIDGLSGLFCVNVGHGRDELAEVASQQMKQLSYFPLWSFAHPPAIRLAERLSAYAPGWCSLVDLFL